MPQSLVYNYIHIVFSTKNRQPLIDSSIKTELYAYIGGICKRLECYPIEIGGYNDHVHILCLLSRKITMMKLVEELKSHSSKWIKYKGDEFKNFYWQNGYGGFSVNPTEINIVSKYITEQDKHHQKRTYQDEYRAFLNKYGVKYDERYMWD
jgi:REP element-mobilizing transposase RayT